MNKTNELLCAHSALPFMVALGAGIFFVAGWLPPINPALDAEGVKTLFVDNGIRIRIGLAISALGCVLWWALSAAIAMQMKRMEGNSHPLTYVQMAASAGTVIPVLLPCFIWLAVAYRIENLPPSLVQLFNDFGWLTFIGMYSPGVLQNVALGICILNNKSDVEPYPRWVGYFCLWMAMLFFPAALLPFFHTGPFTWAGILGFWVVATAFFAWICVMWWMTVRAIKQWDMSTS